MRGRLINAFLVEIAQIDTQKSLRESPGYDPVFQEPIVTIDPVTHQRITGRKENLIRLPAQIESGNYQQLTMLANGNAPKTQLKLVFHFEDLEALDMVDDPARRNTPVRVNDRLVAIYSVEDEEPRLLVSFPNPPGVFITEASPEGFMGDRVNLLVCSLGDRPQGRPGGA